MTLFIGIVFVGGGLFVMTQAADQFVAGAARLALVWRVSPVMVGAVVIGFGTSAPEMVVSGLAAAQGDIDLGVGNVIGSNVANLTLVLGAAALLVTVPVVGSTLRRELPLAVLSMVLFALLIQDGLSWHDGFILTVALVVSLAIIIQGGRAEGAVLPPDVEDFAGETLLARREALRTLLGLAGTVVGAQLLVVGAIDVAEELGLSSGYVGLSLVAIGTSLPELVTTVQAARQRQPGLIVGNLLGSNLFNSLAVGAVIAFAGPGQLTDPTLAGAAAALMVAVGALAWLFLRFSGGVLQWQAIVLLVVYALSLPLLASGEGDDEPDVSGVPSASVPFGAAGP